MYCSVRHCDPRLFFVSSTIPTSNHANVPYCHQLQMISTDVDFVIVVSRHFGIKSGIHVHSVILVSYY